MKKIYTIAFLLLFLVTACSDDNNSKTIKSIEIVNIKDVLEIDKDETFQVDVKVKGSGPISYVSSNPNTFSVTSDGLITAISGGPAKLMIVGAGSNDEWVSISRDIWVNEYAESIVTTSPAADGLNFVPTGTTRNYSTAFTLSPLTSSNRRTLQYISTNPTVATVDEYGFVTPKEKGSTEIYVKTTEGPEIISDKITIYANQSRITVPKTGWTATASSQASVDYGASKIIDGNTSTIWHCPWGGAGTPPPYWILIDMKTLTDFDKITLYRYSAYADTRTVEVYISPVTTNGLAQDDPSFTKIGELYWGDEPKSVTNKSLEYFPGTKHKSRYIKLYLPDTNRAGNNSLQEIYLYNVQ